MPIQTKKPRNEFICFFCISLLLGLFSTYSLAQEAYNADEWTTIKLESLSRSRAPRKIESFELDGLAYAFDATPVQGQWLRVSTRTARMAPDIAITTNATDYSKRTFSKTAPTQCTIEGEIKTCVNLIWVAVKTEALVFSFYWHKSKDLKLDEIKYELAKNGAIDPNNEQRFKKLLSELSEKYFRTSEVDWKLAYSIGSKALKAPYSIDPIPGAIIEVINILPENQETLIFNKIIPRENILTNNLITESPTPNTNYQPTCEEINATSWQLNLPGTYAALGNIWLSVDSKEYIEAAHACLSRPNIEKWTINLTKLKAGYFISPLAAIAPLLGYGPIIGKKKPNGEIEKISINNLNISTGNQVIYNWKNQFIPYKGTIDFVVDETCGTGTCGSVWLAIKGRGKVFGQASKLFAGANTKLDINKTMVLQLTTALLVDSDGKSYTHIQPDEVIDKRVIELP